MVVPMPPAYHTILSSPAFLCLLVGKESKRFLIHDALLSSFPSKALVPSTVEDIDDVVFGRCCEFVYSGDYSITAKPSARQKEPPKYVGRWDSSTLQRNVFHPTKLPGIYERLLENVDHAPRLEDGGSHNQSLNVCANVLLSHAEIFRFGVRTDWTSLCAYSLYRLMKALENLNLIQERTGDIVRLMQFFFEDYPFTENMEDVLGDDTVGDVVISMHNVLRDYIVWNAEIMMQDAGFQKLLDRTPALEKAIFRSMWKY